MMTFAAVLGLALIMPPKEDLSWSPRAGVERNYKMVFNAEMPSFDGSGNTTKIEFRSAVKSLVKLIDEKGVHMEESMGNTELFINGSPMNFGGEETNQTQKEPGIKRLMKSNGELISVEIGKSSTTSARMEQMNAFAFPAEPVAVGESWFRDVKANKERGFLNGRAKYTYEGFETVNGIKCWRVKHAYSELDGAKPMGAIGTTWLDASNGFPVVIEAQVNDMQFSDGMPSMHGNFRMTLSK